jgi:hypothetical protein
MSLAYGLSHTKQAKLRECYLIDDYKLKIVDLEIISIVDVLNNLEILKLSHNIEEKCVLFWLWLHRHTKI